jgi:hypothetical protein
MLGLLNTVLTRGGSLLTYVKEGLVMANRFLTPPKLTFPVNGSAEFDGASDYIQLDNAFSYTNHTIAAWVYANDTANNKVIFDNRDVNDDGIGIYLDGSEQVYYLLNTSDLGPFSVTADDWVFITATYDGTTQKFYIDGSLSGSQAASQTISVSSDSVIGAQNVPKSNYYSGNLANVAIWNRALSSDEINSVMWKSYEKLTATESNGLQAWYKLQESELISGDSTATLEKYAAANSLTFEGKTCLQTALNALPTITDARLYSAKYDIRVSADGGNVESLNCVETELNAIL